MCMSRRQTERCLPRAREFGLSWLEDQRVPEKILYGLAKSGGLRRAAEDLKRELATTMGINAPLEWCARQADACMQRVEERELRDREPELEQACSRVLEEMVHVNTPADFMHLGMADPLTVAERLQDVLQDAYGIDASLEVPP